MKALEPRLLLSAALVHPAGDDLHNPAILVPAMELVNGDASTASVPNAAVQALLYPREVVFVDAATPPEVSPLV